MQFALVAKKSPEPCAFSHIGLHNEMESTVGQQQWVGAAGKLKNNLHILSCNQHVMESTRKREATAMPSVWNVKLK